MPSCLAPLDCSPATPGLQDRGSDQQQIMYLLSVAIQNHTIYNHVHVQLALDGEHFIPITYFPVHAGMGTPLEKQMTIVLTGETAHLFHTTTTSL